MRRFAVVAAGQMVSAVGSALTAFAVPLWTYLETGSLLRFALYSVLAQVPGISRHGGQPPRTGGCRRV